MAQGGKSLQDRELAARVRSKTLQKIEQILDGDKKLKLSKRQEALVFKLAPSILPRLNEHTGENGEPIEVKMITGMKIVNESGQNN